ATRGDSPQRDALGCSDAEHPSGMEPPEGSIAGRGNMATRATTFRSEVSNSKLVTALVAGFVATHVATIFGFWFHGFDLPDLAWPTFNGILLLGKDASPLSIFWAGTVC